MKINFIHSSLPVQQKISNAIREYEKIWNKEGELIVEKIQKISGMSFTTRDISGVVYEGKSMSHPLMLRYDYSYDFKKAVLIHELLHILLVDNKIKHCNSISVHKEIYSYYYDILLDMYGKEFLSYVIEKESEFGDMYRETWEAVKNLKNLD